MTATFVERLQRASLGPRVLTAVVGIPVLFLVLWAGGVWWTGLTVLVAVLAMREFVRLHALGTVLRIAVLILLLAAFGLFLASDGTVLRALVVVWAIVIAVAGARYFSPRDLDPRDRPVGALLLGPLYLAAPTALLGRWRSELPAWSVLAFLLVIWANDTAAYFVGLAAGRHKMAPRISPGKSWEGAAAGAAAGGLVGVLTASMLGMRPGQALLFGLLTTIASQIGDLFESAMKRKAGLKDSGALLPGHGGILDRFDGILLAAPIAYVLVRLWAAPP